MNATLQRRLQALEARHTQAATTDSPEAREAAAELERLFAAHDHDGELLARFHVAADSAERAVVTCDLLDRAGPEAERQFLNLLAVAEGRQPCHVNAPERKES
jgi:hypothetical protein